MQVQTYVVCDLSNDPRGVIRLKAIFDKWEIFDDLLEIFGVNLALNRRAVKRDCSECDLQITPGRTNPWRDPESVCPRVSGQLRQS